MPDRIPRIQPLTDSEASAEIQSILKDWPYNLHRMLAHNSGTLKKWMPFAEHILQENSLPEREREIAILRVAWNSQCAYEWGLHVRLARSLGFTDMDVLSLAAENPETVDLPVHERAVMLGVDEIMETWEVSDTTWSNLEARFTAPQLIDFVFVTCQFMLVAVTLKTMRVPLEVGIEPLPTPAS
jgi:4-carboxymuconolactone decarboxylase